MILGGETIEREKLERKLRQEISAIRDEKRDPEETIVIIRAHRSAKSGKLQDLIEICQQVRFQHFALRASKEKPKS